MYVVGEYDDHDDVIPAIAAPEQGAWQGPTDLESELYRLNEAEDNYGYLRLIAAEGVYHPVPVTGTERRPGRRRLRTQLIEDGRTIACVYTVGVLPRPHPYMVYEFITLATLAAICPREVDVLVVNGATPCAQFFPTRAEERQVWRELHDELFDPDELCNRLITQRTRSLPPGDLRHGLACGALLCYENGDAWNTLDWHGPGYSNELERLEDWWEVRTREDWLEVQEQLLRCEVTPWYWDFVLGARTVTRQRHGVTSGPVDPALWRECVEVKLRDQVYENEGPDAACGPGEDPELDDFVAYLQGLVGKILRYEARFRADGILPENGFTRSVAAWDLGRASQMARWGRGARFATRAEMYEALERTGAAARDAYTSWTDFSVGYILGRCLHFDEEEFGDWYTSSLAAHRVLTTDPESPWLTVPWSAEA